VLARVLGEPIEHLRGNLRSAGGPIQYFVISADEIRDAFVKL
jgi:hypothetical protein